MIEIKNAAKYFGRLRAIDNISCAIKGGSVFGIVGSNGAGKSTLLRMISGVYSPDEGQVSLDGKIICNSPVELKNFVFLPDTPVADFKTTLKSTAAEYAAYYEGFDWAEYKALLGIFKLDPSQALSSFSKGMLRQAMIIIALSCPAKYIILDETLDGLDPAIRTLVKKKIYGKVISSNAAVIISSHSLRELEDFCDSLILLHEGKLIYNQSMEDAEASLCKVQVAFKEPKDDALNKTLTIVKRSKSGSVSNLIVKGSQADVLEAIKKLNPILLDVIPMSIEEIFTYELEKRGYGIDIIDENILNTEDK